MASIPSTQDSLVSRHRDVAPLLHVSAQRAKILEAMVQAVGEKGYAAATVADAVKLARVSRGTFYAEFDSKEACFAAAHRLGCDVLEEMITKAVRSAQDWREELRLGIRAYLDTLQNEPRFARIYLLEAHNIPRERDAALRRFATRYAKTFARSGRPVPPPDALFLLSAGVAETACAHARAGKDVRELEDTLVGCAVRLVTKEDEWT